jgi:hypothetical protein
MVFLIAALMDGSGYASMQKLLDEGLKLVAVILALTMLCGCATKLTADEQQARRAELDAMADTTIVTLLEMRPEAAEYLEQCVGYAVIDMRVTKIPVFGGGGGYGVVRDERSGARAYTKVSRFEIGGGLGAQKYKVIVFFSDAKLLERAIGGAWHFDAGAEAVVGEESREGHVGGSDEGYRAFRVGESGAVATVTIRMARAQPYLN